MASGVQLDAGKVMEAVRSPGDHRRDAAGKVLWQTMVVNGESKDQRGREKEARSTRTRRSP
jgi:hypothetical protein